MIIKVSSSDEKLINDIENIFNDIYVQKNELKNEFLNNPYTQIYIYKENNSIVGLIHINDIYDRYEVNNIYVLKQYRNKKIATKLLEKIISLAQIENKINITLEVKNDNISAINLYKKHGFVAKATRKGYYKGTDGILMEKEMM